MFNYSWKLSDGYPAKGIEGHNKKVFTTFACGGGSSMGYKLAGYDVIAANDIDPQMARVYKKNHNPKYFYECGVEELLNQELPKELYGIDILDGSPPCSTFSMSGSREKAWGKEKMFREGQAVQVLDDLFFQFIKLAEDETLVLGSSFPADYDFDGLDVKYLCGMSVPPVMMANVANEVYSQWLSKI